MIKKMSIIEILHILFIFIIIIITSFYVRSENLVIYLLFSFSFSINVFYSLRTILYKKKGEFFYLFSLLLFLGFVSKFSVHTIFQYDYLEPIGGYDFSILSEYKVLLVSIMGALGLFVAQLLSNINETKKINNYPAERTNLRIQIILLITAMVLSLINLKFNILLFGRVPSFQIPFKGNAIFFLFLTRGLLFLHLYYLTDKIKMSQVLIGGFIASLCSIGVLSRGITIVYFCTIFLIILKQFVDVSNKERLKVGLIFLVTFLLFSAITVKSSTDLRKIYYNMNETVSSASTPILSSSKSSAKTYLKLVVDRWIGTEGVMSVVGYSERNMRLLLDALSEGSYKGVSFFSKISDPATHLRLSNTVDKKVVSTSVPGPVAFSYYSGSIIFTSFFLFLTTFLINTIVRKCRTSLMLNESTLTYIAVFLTFDFIQFGIAPSSLLKNWAFTFVLIILFSKRHILQKTKNIILEKFNVK